MLRSALLFLSESSLARRMATGVPLARAAARRFVAGEGVDDAITAARALNDAGATVSLDYLGESVHNREEAREAADVYLRVLNRIAADGLRANVSLKLTAMGQDIDEGFLRENISRVLDRAQRDDIFVRFDMESSAYTQRTIDFFTSLWEAGRRNIGIVLQSYLRRSESDVRLANELGCRVRLCKGAYKEPASVAYPDKGDVDANFVKLMQMLLSQGVYPGIATHDEKMLRATREFAAARSIPSSDFEFQMLYGVRRDLQKELLADGYGLRVYVPFGGAWYPYLMRRMAERPANLFFIVGNLWKEGARGGSSR